MSFSFTIRAIWQITGPESLGLNETVSLLILFLSLFLHLDCIGLHTILRRVLDPVLQLYYEGTRGHVRIE